jgi:RNA polymerase sigma-70 factor (ECF subfamily)
MAAAGELNEALHKAMQALSVEQRSALVLVAFEGMSYAEAAEVQQCPAGTLAWRVAEARRRLAEKLGPHLERTGGSDHAM